MDQLCLKSRIFKGATVGVALRGHPLTINVMSTEGGHGGPPLQLFL